MQEARKEFFKRKMKVDLERQEGHRKRVNEKLIEHKYKGQMREGETRDDR